MRLYDIALTLIRASVALGIIGEVGQQVWDLRTLSALQATSALITTIGPAGLNNMQMLEITNAIHPIYSIAVQLVILANSKRLARFAARFAGPTDAAADFR